MTDKRDTPPAETGRNEPEFYLIGFLECYICHEKFRSNEDLGKHLDKSGHRLDATVIPAAEPAAPLSPQDEIEFHAKVANATLGRIYAKEYKKVGEVAPVSPEPPRTEEIVQKIADKYYWRVKGSDSLVEIKQAIREALTGDAEWHEAITCPNCLYSEDACVCGTYEFDKIGEAEPDDSEDLELRRCQHGIWIADPCDRCAPSNLLQRIIDFAHEHPLNPQLQVVRGWAAASLPSPAPQDAAIRADEREKVCREIEEYAAHRTITRGSIAAAVAKSRASYPAQPVRAPLQARLSNRPVRCAACGWEGILEQFYNHRCEPVGSAEKEQG